MSEEVSLNKKTFFATLWTVGARLGVRLIGFISLFILAKILGPDEFGLVAKATLIHEFLYLITEVGLEVVLITNQKANKDHYSTAWTLQIIRGFILAAILAALAYPASIYMNDPRLELIIYCLAGVAILDGLYNIYVVDFRKEMVFSKDFYFVLGVKITGFVVTVGLAAIYQTYWALVAGAAAVALARVFFSFVMIKDRPTVSLKEFASIFHFSKWVTVNEIIKAVLMKIDEFLLSIYSTSSNVGLFKISREVSYLPTTEMAMPVARACTPGFSKISHDLPEFAKMYVATLSVLFVLTIPASTGVVMLAEPLVLVLLGPKWIDAIPVIKVLALYGLCQASIPIYISAALASKRPDLLTIRSAITALYTTVILYFAIQNYGFMGMVWAGLLCGIISVIIAQSMMRNLKLLSVRKLFVNIWRSIVANIAMAAGLYYFLKIDIPILEGFLPIELLVDILVGGVIYGGTLMVLWIACKRPEGPEKAMLNTLLGGRFGTA